jgi:hypothetical protein
MIQKKTRINEQKLDNRNINWNVKSLVIAPKFDAQSKIEKIEYREWKFSVILN